MQLPQRKFEKISPFVSSLSVLSFLFALTMNVFGYTIFYFLETNHIPIIYGGIGTTVGQIVLLFIVIPQGRLIDKGKSYTLMIAGALIYSVSIILFFVDTNFVLPMAALLATSLIAIVLVTQNTFKSSLSAFIGKAVKSNVIGKHYSRIVMMETAGGTVAMFAVAATILFSDIGMIYLIPGIILFTATILSLFFLFPEQRKHIRNEENKTHRPGFIESVRTFRDRKRFIAPLLFTKIFMSIGVYGVSYFFIISGQRIGIEPIYSILLLGVGFAASVPFGIYSERFVDRKPDIGKSYVVAISFLDVFLYLFLVIAFFMHIPYLFYLSMGFSIPGPLLVAGAMSYELKIIGKEHRGMFAAIQRTLVGITFIILGIPFAFLFSVDFTLIWIFVLAGSVGSLVSAILLPSRDFIENNYMKNKPSDS